jgi:hypothetical protein
MSNPAESKKDEKHTFCKGSLSEGVLARHGLYQGIPYMHERRHVAAHFAANRTPAFAILSSRNYGAFHFQLSHQQIQALNEAVD